MNQEKIGKLISIKRKQKNLTQDQLAEKLGVTNKAVSKWENGKSMPDLSIIQDLCKILGISVTTLLNGEDNKDDELVIKLLWIIDRLKQFKYAIIGLLIMNLAYQIENLKVFDFPEKGTFIKGFCDGSFAGLKLVGVCIFAYGIAAYIKRNNQK